jgi:hypothetical protein
MLLFRSEEHVERWCRARDVPRRPVVSLDKLWVLAVAWYDNRLTEDSRRPGPEEMRDIFDALDLTGPFWDVG